MTDASPTGNRSACMTLTGLGRCKRCRFSLAQARARGSWSVATIWSMSRNASTAANTPVPVPMSNASKGAADFGNGAFATALGLTMDGSKFGMGTRSQRYSMIVNDGVVEQLHVEAPGEFKVSSAEYLLNEI